MAADMTAVSAKLEVLQKTDHFGSGKRNPDISAENSKSISVSGGGSGAGSRAGELEAKQRMHEGNIQKVMLRNQSEPSVSSVTEQIETAKHQRRQINAIDNPVSVS